MKQSMLTTVDNPHDPFDDFDSWLAYDQSAGYHSLSLLDRIVVSSDDLSQLDNLVAIENAIDEIIFENTLGIFKKVTKEIDPG